MKFDLEELIANVSILLISAAILLMKLLMNESSLSTAKTRKLRLLKAKQPAVERPRFRSYSGTKSNWRTPGKCCRSRRASASRQHVADGRQFPGFCSNEWRGNSSSA